MESALFYHLVFPPKLPQREDANLDEIESALVAHLISAARSMIQTSAGGELGLQRASSAWESLERCLRATRSVNRHGGVNKTRMLAEMRSMTASDTLIIHVRSQNAGIIVHRLINEPDQVVFEVFEASPKNEDVLAAGNALQWDFPGAAVAVPLETFEDPDFQSSLATFLEQASLESTKAFAAVAYKAQTDSHEYRNTASPTMISSLLMAILEENGKKISTPLLRKRVRDDVCWNNAARPWRRLPYWLVLRVSIARYLSLRLGPDLGRFEYKVFLCVVFTSLTGTLHGTLSAEQQEFFKAKLCRRLVKLEGDKDSLTDALVRQQAERRFSIWAPRIEDVAKNFAHNVRSEWEAFKKKVSKEIQPLHRLAPSNDMLLPLPNSGDKIRQIKDRSNAMMKQNAQRSIPPKNFDLSSLTTEHLAKFSRPLFELANEEDLLVRRPGTTIQDVSRQIHRYVIKALPVYHGNVEQMSILILNAMELWVRLDKLACAEFPLLRYYHPVFTSESLDALRLPRFQDMVRLHRIQEYLHGRIVSTNGSRTNVFGDPSSACFAARYYDEGPDARAMHDLHQLIAETDLQRKQSKQEEWERKSAVFKQLAQQVAGSACIFMVDEHDPYATPSHDENVCPRCLAERRMTRMRIQIYECSLPAEGFMAKATVFELSCPPNFAEYRDTSWMLISRLATSDTSAAVEPRCLLRDYSQLREFGGRTTPSVTLASLTKSFLATHYAFVRFPVEWEGGKDGLCKPNGLKLAYYDVASNTWTGRSRTRPTFVHHLQLQLPQKSPFQSVVQDKVYSADSPGPSSYEIIATRPNCPSGLNPHEFLALKTLTSGYARRWLSILVELGSTNLNWSSETTMSLINHLALQCGPTCDQNDPLRLVHLIFRDLDFVVKLLDQIQTRITTLAALASWREAHLMGIMITLALRVVEMAGAADLDPAVQDRAVRCVVQAREICIGWCRVLKDEIRNSREISMAQQLQQRALASALLCRRTFDIHCAEGDCFDQASLEAYVESGIAMQENMATKVETLPPNILQDLISVLKASSRFEPLAARSIAKSKDGLRNALSRFWPEADRMASSTTVKFLEKGWVCCDIPQSRDERHQVVHFNMLLGTLLVNFKPVGKLPQDSQNSLVVRELFGNQPLMVYQSSVPGMSYTLTHRPHDFTVHVGYEGNQTVIIARKGENAPVRLIPRDIFYKGQVLDLPAPLILEHLHWLNLDNGDVYITPIKSPWKQNRYSWILNIHRNVCRRLRDRFGMNERVIDPLCPLFRRAAKILEGLANDKQLYVTQPSHPGRRMALEVHIPNMQLMFFVKPNQYLYSPQLDLEIDPNQDAGTWYGLRHKLVCRKVDNPFRRTILVPLGKVVPKRLGCHVSVEIIVDGGKYGKYDINDTLGRIDCAAEPRLVYTKAMLHAFTSFVIPDPLTGRTGVEESLNCLNSGICHPWTVLGPESSVLSQIAGLTPTREYYPPNMKEMKTDLWSEDLTAHIQHPLFRPLVENILTVVKNLENFTPRTACEDIDSQDRPQSAGDHWLNERAYHRRRLNERPLPFDDEIFSTSRDKVYLSRDKRSCSDVLYAKVLEITHLMRAKPARFQTPHNLAAVLAQGNIIGGYESTYDKVSLSDRMHTDIRENWGSLVQYCLRSQSRYDLIFLFANLVFRHNVDDCLVKALAAFAIFPDLGSLVLPPWPSYFNFRPNSSPQLEDMVRLISGYKTPLPRHEFDELGSMMNAKQRHRLEKDKEALAMKSEEDCHYLAKFILAQWPRQEPDLSSLPRHDLLVNVAAAFEAVRGEWLRLYQNMELASHLKKVQSVLDMRRSTVDFSPRLGESTLSDDVLMPSRSRGGEIPSLDGDLLNKAFRTGMSDARMRGWLWDWTPFSSTPQDGRQPSVRDTNRRAAESNAKPNDSPHEAMKHIRELEDIVHHLGHSKSLVRKTYAQNLLASLQAFRSLRTPNQLAKPFLNLRDYRPAQAEVLRTFGSLKSSVEREAPGISARRIRWLKLGGLWPAVTTVALLEQLGSIRNNTFGNDVRDGLIAFGLAITRLQQVMRMNDAVLAGDISRFQDEENNMGHSNWKPEENPDWLLLEIESNLLIRPGQVDVARATISPASGANSVLQMNMGQGKTSCIIPMVAAAMADRKSLVRVIVPKALLLQTAQLLQSRLGGLLNRCIRHVPFSRRTDTSQNNIRLFFNMHKEILKMGGVMLCLPEHNLSFMLSGQQRLLDERVNEAGPMINVHNWLKTVSRDILDESDYTLAARTQLIYPSGSQMSVDGHPHRWQVIEAVLSLVDRNLYGLGNSFPHSIEVVRRAAGGFPLVYFLRQDVEDELLRRLTSDILKGLDDILPMRSLDSRDRIAVKDFLAQGNRKLRADTSDRIRKLCPDRPQVRQTVYLLRGLLVNRILIMTLKKRWNVQYGLHPDRDPVAVPFHAKGVPSEQSEWGHPDVAILFTVLAFYYDGVTKEQLKQGLTRVLKSDDPSTEYDKWVQSSRSMPDSLKAWNTINVEDDDQIHEIWMTVRHQVVVIDYFLNNLVFPRHAKQFKVKLQSSGWDIPLFSAAQVLDSKKIQGKPLTTGFSGTNDNRTMLPLTVKQSDLPSLSHTNAEVLTYLLHQRSRACEVMVNQYGRRASEIDLLFMLKRRRIRVLIDAGAQILEMDNETLAMTWLGIDHNSEAALYFDSSNRPWIISRTNFRRTPLLASPYSEDLSKVLVYLDEAHTRGTDLKFPLNARGALTVGQGQTKDHTVQAAMRLRQLGRSQSVTFFVPVEVHQVIADLRGKSTSDEIDSHDVICWLLDNTCEGIEQLQPLYFSQGSDFCRRVQAEIDNPNYLTDPSHREEYIAAIKQNELQTLRAMYEPKTKGGKTREVQSSNPSVAGFMKELKARRKGFQDTGRAVHGSALQEVEQEREVAFEVEAIRQVKKPIHYEPLTFPGLHREIELFARTGRLPVDSHYIQPVFRLLSKTFLGRKHRVAAKSSHLESRLFVSAEFERTVRLYTDLSKDSFLRPVSWLLWSEEFQTALVLIPEEAEHIIRMIHAGRTHQHVHLVTYATPVTRSMLPFNNLSFYSMPSMPNGWIAPQWLKTELGLLSGRLYFEWDEYDALCKFFGVDEDSMNSMELEEEDAQIDQVDGTGHDGQDEQLHLPQQNGHATQKKVKSFSARPLTFLQEWLAVRRNGQEFVHTPMGFLTQGKPLHANHPFFGGVSSPSQTNGVTDERKPAPYHSVRRGGAVAEDEEDVFDGVDDMGANVGDDDIEGEEMEVVYDDGEYWDSSGSSP